MARMSQLTNPALQDLSVVYQLCFAARTLPIGSPNYWEIAAHFSIEGKNQYSLTEKKLEYLSKIYKYAMWMFLIQTINSQESW